MAISNYGFKKGKNNNLRICEFLDKKSIAK